MLYKVSMLIVQAGGDEIYQDVQESYDSIAQLVKLFFIFVVILVVFRLIYLLTRRETHRRDSDAKISGMRSSMQDAAKKKIASRKGESKELDEVD